MYTFLESDSKAYARRQRSWRRRAAASASRSAREAAFSSRGTIFSATSSPFCSSPASHTLPDPPARFTPLLRLAGLIAFAILIVVLLVFWVQSCQGASKRSAYRKYMQAVTTIGQSSEQTGRELNDLLTTPGLKEADLEQKLDSFAQQEKQN